MTQSLPTLCWSYKKLDQRAIVTGGTMSYEEYLDTNLKWYKLSIYKAKQLGYPTVMYCDDHLLEYWQSFEYLDEVNLVPIEFAEWYWDGYKFYALYVRDDFPIAMDHDVILNTHFIDKDVKVLVDSFDEDRHLIWRNRNVLNWYEDNGVIDIVPEWNKNPQPLACSGVIQIKDKGVKDLFFKRYLDLYQFMLDNNIDPHWGTGIGGEALISFMANFYGWSTSAFNQCIVPELQYENNTYTHYFGNWKYRPGIVEFDYTKKKSAL